MYVMTILYNLYALLVFAVFSDGVREGSHSNWNYQNQDKWSSVNRECEGEKQSPINIDTVHVLPNQKLKLDFQHYSQNMSNYIATNTGHSIQFTFIGKPEETPAISGYALNNQTFILKQLHFHWGQQRGVGSEHTVDGVRYDIELHLVHFNRDKYESFEKALHSHQGVAVLAVLFEIHQKPRDRFSSLIETIEQMIDYQMNQTTRLKHPLKLGDLLPQRDTGSNEDQTTASFYRYNGSLTTPPCTEGITWLIFSRPQSIGQQQIKVFRAMKNFQHRTEGNNYRRLQRLNGRKVEASGQ